MKLPRRGWLRKSRDGEGWDLYIPISYPMPVKERKRTTEALFGGTNRPFPLTMIPTVTPPQESSFPVLIHRTPDNRIKVGPFIGVLTTRSGKKILGNLSNFKDLLKTARALGGIGYVFTPEDIDWTSQEITGYLYQPEIREWIAERLPIPDIVYNRIPNRKSEQLPMVLQALSRLQELPGVHLFNPRFFNKWELYEILKATPLRVYLPETRLFASFYDLQEMVKRFGHLYIKPADGKAGNGIMRLEAKNDGILLHRNGSKKRERLTFKGVFDLWRHIKKDVLQNQYLIQEAVPLLTYNQSPFDVRLLVQKNRHGQWEVSGLGIRVAGKESITTHVPQGGFIVRPEEALVPHFGPAETGNLLKRLGNVAIEIAKALENHYRHLGELSMDLGISQEGNIWFFEANAKPMKFDEPEIRKVSLQRIIQYSHYLFFHPPK